MDSLLIGHSDCLILNDGHIFLLSRNDEPDLRDHDFLHMCTSDLSSLLLLREEPSLLDNQWFLLLFILLWQTALENSHDLVLLRGRDVFLCRARSKGRSGRRSGEERDSRVYGDTVARNIATVEGSYCSSHVVRLVERFAKNHFVMPIRTIWQDLNTERLMWIHWERADESEKVGFLWLCDQQLHWNLCLFLDDKRLHFLLEPPNLLVDINHVLLNCLLGNLRHCHLHSILNTIKLTSSITTQNTRIPCAPALQLDLHRTHLFHLQPVFINLLKAQCHILNTQLVNTGWALI
ncbi:hypothetical protein BDQ12DRAFT_684895, partial [Crucibulum laeve]